MINAFDSEVAKLVGVNAAVLFKNIEYWVEKNATNGQNEHDGRFWTYNSVKAFSEQFPYMTEKQTRSALKRLEDSGLVEAGVYNDAAYDRTKWYTLTDEGVRICRNGNIHLPMRANQTAPQGEPIPDDNQMTTSKEPPKAPQDGIQESVDEVTAHLNELTGKRFNPRKDSTRKPIAARLREGYSASDCIAVIDCKVAQWSKDPRMRTYLRPETLFKASKFEAYLNESPVVDMADCPF